MNRPDANHLFAASLDLYRQGRIPEAESTLRAVMSTDPRHVDAIHLLAIIGYQRGNAQGAIPLLRRATQIEPNFALAWNTLGECYRQIGLVNDAAASYRRAIACDGTMGAPHSNLALVLCESGQLEAGAEAARRAIELDPQLITAYGILASALNQLGRRDEALAALQRAAEVQPDSAPTQNNLGTVLEAMDRLPEAAEAYRRAVELDPSLAVSCNNYINIARQLNRWDDAMDWTDRALRIDPSFVPAQWNQGLLQLTLGDYANGWPNYERRFRGTEQRHPALLTGRPWNHGDDLSEKTLLLYAEQGFGDGFQAARYVPIIAGRVGRLVILCHREQARLFARLPGVSLIVSGGDPLPPYDRFAAMMSLPYMCGTPTLQTIPRSFPYLSPPPEVTAKWHDRLAGQPGPKVGLIWAGASKPDPLRTVPLAQLAPLLSIPGIHWYGLQVGAPAADLRTVPGGDRVTDLSPDLTDFAETAGVMQELDLIVTIDSAVCHLAGALGRPTWTLLPFSPDWRWLLERTDSPWYPSMRLFRQAERKQWGPVVARVADELRAWVPGR